VHTYFKREAEVDRTEGHAKQPPKSYGFHLEDQGGKGRNSGRVGRVGQGQRTR